MSSPSPQWQRFNEAVDELGWTDTSNVQAFNYSVHHVMQALRVLLATTHKEPAPVEEPAVAGCGSCMTCDAPTGPWRSRMYLCATCGNKRCPAATDCRRWECSGSNELGQTPIRRTRNETNPDTEETPDA